MHSVQSYCVHLLVNVSDCKNNARNAQYQTSVCVSSTNVRDRLSHKYETKGTRLVLYPLAFMFRSRKWKED